jgi:carbon-monoxide dehydrogenase medium subunit
VVALGGTLVISGPRGERTVPSVEFHRGFLETALAADELLTEIRVPKWTGARWSFQKFNRRAQDWAIVGVVAVRNGSTAVSLVNMGSVPLRASAVERAVAGGASAEEAAELAAEGTEPSADLHASVEFRQHLARVLVRRALEEVGG